MFDTFSRIKDILQTKYVQCCMLFYIKFIGTFFVYDMFCLLKILCECELFLLFSKINTLNHACSLSVF